MKRLDPSSRQLVSEALTQLLGGESAQDVAERYGLNPDELKRIEELRKGHQVLREIADKCAKDLADRFQSLQEENKALLDDISTLEFERLRQNPKAHDDS